MIIIAQTLSAFFAALVVTKSYADLKRGRENIVMFLFWTVAWMIILGIAIYPNIINILIVRFGGQRTGMGTIFGLALTFLFFIMYRLYIKADRVEKDVHKLIRDIAILAENSKKKNY